MAAESPGKKMNLSDSHPGDARQQVTCKTQLKRTQAIPSNQIKMAADVHTLDAQKFRKQGYRDSQLQNQTFYIMGQETCATYMVPSTRKKFKNSKRRIKR